MNKEKIKIGIAIGLSAIEFVALLSLKNTIFSELLNDDSKIIEILSIVTPTGLMYVLNFYIFAPLFHFLFLEFRFLTGHYKHIKLYYQKIIKDCMNWLISLNCHWGTFATSTECQNTNTCEGLLALKKSNICNSKSQIYNETALCISKNLTEQGLYSKSLSCTTVVPTSMILYWASLEKENNIGVVEDFQIFENLSTYLWDNRSNRGWGVYVTKMSDEYCCFANTFWALRALNKYSISKTDEYKEYIKRIYEYNTDSKFGFNTNDPPRLVTTSMAVSLYYKLEPDIKNEVAKSFDVKKAIRYIFDNFVNNGIQCEVETLCGIDFKTPGAKKSPWTHISAGYAIEALNLAYLNKNIGLLKMNLFISKVKTICNKNLIYAIPKQSCYYVPSNIEGNTNGIYTFPTAYMIWGLSSFKPK